MSNLTTKDVIGITGKHMMSLRLGKVLRDLGGNMRGSILLAALVVVSTTAHADWQRTKWGMTLEQATAAMAGPDFATDPGCHYSVDPPDSWGEHIIYRAAAFQFQGCLQGTNASGLDRVGLSLMTGDNPGFEANQLQASLEAKYGAPFKDTTSGILGDVEWHSGNDRIILTRMMSAAFAGHRSTYVVMLDYTPLMTAETKGL